ncbi:MULTISPECIES: type IV pilin-like G/H family protein [unclassified Microcoleus]|uniref:type IV pilin-like G/H family protein n=1 Tax=unclassified Microcoleus TaxID=2642155 RepID=UPI0025F484B4|nr:MULTISPECIES: type IV pilin-like G/H family protein [unclassified Microcoleus]
MQLKEKPELNQINEQSKFLAKTYQPDRPLTEPKSVAKVDRTNLQPIQEPKSVAKVDRTNLQPIKEPQSVAKVDRTNLQPIKEPQSVAKVDRTNLQPLKEPKSVAKVDRQDLQPLKEPKSVTTVDRQDLRPIKNLKSVAKTYQPDLRSINEYKSGEGTSRIIDFFVVVIIIGILAHIALPSFLHCGNKAMQSEAKQYVGSMNRAQQAYFADKGAFSNSITALGIGIKTQTTNYNYSIGATKNAAFSYAGSRNEKHSLLSHVGAVFLVPSSAAYNYESTTVSILCQANSPGKTQPPNPILQNGVPVCAAGSSEVPK